MGEQGSSGAGGGDGVGEDGQGAGEAEKKKAGEAGYTEEASEAVTGGCERSDGRG